jgi:hypothetical protein
VTRLSRRIFLAAAAGLPLVLLWREKAWSVRRAFIRAGLTKPPANRLRNAGFLQRTAQGFPDYWGTDAAAVLGRLDSVWALDDSSPVSGTRALRIRHDRDGYLLKVMACREFVPEARIYALSVYLRSDADNRSVQLSLGWSASREVAVGREWRRHVVLATPESEARARAALEVRIGVPAHSTVWMAAPQVEAANQAGPFDLALMDDHPLPEITGGEDRQRERPRNAVGPVVDPECPIRTAVAVLQPDEQALRDIAAAGFDTVTIFTPIMADSGSPASPAAAARQRFDMAERCGLKVVGFLSARTASAAERMEASVALVTELKDHPAMLAWQYLDEPSRQASPGWRDIAALYSAVRRADPAHPVFLNENRWNAGGGDALRQTDVACVDVYAIGRYVNAVRAVGDTAWQMNADSERAGKASAMWLPMYGYDDAVREPTMEEARAMSYVAAMHGCSLLMQWIYRPMSSSLWRAFSTINKELRRLVAGGPRERPRLLRSGVREGRLHYAFWRTGRGELLLACCNTDPRSVVNAIDLDAAGAARLPAARALFDDGGTSLRVGSRLWIFLPAYGRQVYELTAA